MAPEVSLRIAVDVDLHTRTQITLLPMSSKRLSISPALLFRKDQTQRGEIIIVRQKGNKSSK